MTFVQRLVASVEEIVGGLAARFPYIVAGIVLILLSWWISRIVHRSVRAVMARTSTEGHVDLIIAKAAGAGAFLLGLLVALGVMGVSVAALMTSLGLVGLALGFALRDVLGNSMAGILLLVERPFTVGDSISVASIEGVVRDIRVRDTLLEAPDGRFVFVPNSTVFNEPITNTSSARRRRLEVRVPVSTAGDLDRATEVARQALAGVAGVCDDPAPEAEYASVRVTTAVLAAHAWVDTAETGFGSVQNAANLAVTSALREAGLLRA